MLLIIGRQVINSFGKRLDLLAMDSEGALYVIEVKRDRTPRQVVAQASTKLGRTPTDGPVRAGGLHPM